MRTEVINLPQCVHPRNTSVQYTAFSHEGRIIGIDQPTPDLGTFMTGRLDLDHKKRDNRKTFLKTLETLFEIF